MAEVVILSVDGSGNVPPAVAIGRELMKRGHAVRVLGNARQASDVLAHGLDFAPYQHAFPWSGQAPRSSTRAAADFVRLVGDRGVGKDLADAHAARAADVVLVDAMIPGALIAARRLEVPAVSLMHTFAGFFMGLPMEAAGLVGGFSPRRQWSSARTLVVSDRVLDPAGTTARADDFVWTGVAEPPPHNLASPALLGSMPPPVVLVSLSSVHIPAQVGMFRRILAALRPLPVRVVVTTGPTVDPALLEAPQNAAVHRFLPHHDVLPDVSLVIGHGGHSTTMRALMHDVPLLVLPADPRIDQSMVGKAVHMAGAGLCLRRGSSAAAIRAAAVRLLSDGRYAEAAAVAGKRLRDAGGTQVAADYVEALARGGATAGMA